MGRITNDLSLIVNELRSGNVVALPTETVYGLAADATNQMAVKKIFEIKKRPFNHPLITHVAPGWDLTQWVEEIPEYAARLIKHFWPGPLTLVFKLKKQAHISLSAMGSQNTIAIRSPDHPLTLQILNKLDRPIVAPSANPFGKVSPTEAHHVMQDFPQHCFSILEGGHCNIGIESTIINCIDEASYSILRQGIISQSEIQNFCDVSPLPNNSNIRISGGLKTHYQPKKTLFYFESTERARVKPMFFNVDQYYFLSFSLGFNNHPVNYLFPSCPKKAAKEFYRQLRIADQSNKNRIIIELPPNKPEWSALIERIKKAGSCLSDKNFLAIKC